MNPFYGQWECDDDMRRRRPWWMVRAVPPKAVPGPKRNSYINPGSPHRRIKATDWARMRRELEAVDVKVSW